MNDNNNNNNTIDFENAVRQATGTESNIPADKMDPVGNGDPSSRPKCFSSTIQECVFVLTTTMAIGQNTFFTGLNVGVTASVAKDLHMKSAEITWITSGAAYVFYLLFLLALDTIRGVARFSRILMTLSSFYFPSLPFLLLLLCLFSCIFFDSWDN